MCPLKPILSDRKSLSGSQLTGAKPEVDSPKFYRCCTEIVCFAYEHFVI